MTCEETRAAVLAALKGIAPELAESEVKADRPLREQVDLDSMDWLNFLVVLNERLGVDIPESDYRKLRTLNEIVAYLGDREGA